MDQGMVNFKVFLHKNNTNVDCRRMGIDAAVSASFIYLREKLEMMFPILRNNAYNIKWIDSDDDAITIMCDEDLITAITDMTGCVKVLHVHTDTNTPDFMSETGVDVPMTVVCDGCDKNITQSRYKCLQCPDYDLCSNCEQKGHHSDHIMLRSPEPQLPRCIPKLMICLSRSIHRSQMQAAKEMSRADRPNRGSASFSSFGRNGKGRQFRKECPFGEFPFLLNFENLATSLASTLENITSPAKNNANESPAPTSAEAPASAPNNQNPTTNPTTTPTPASTPTPKYSSGYSTPNKGSIYPNIPMETENLSKLPENDWTFVQPQPTTKATTSAPADPPKSNIVEGLQQLLEIGFKNEEQLVSLLIKYEGNVGMVIKYLLDNAN